MRVSSLGVVLVGCVYGLIIGIPLAVATYARVAPESPFDDKFDMTFWPGAVIIMSMIVLVAALSSIERTVSAQCDRFYPYGVLCHRLADAREWTHDSDLRTRGKLALWTSRWHDEAEKMKITCDAHFANLELILDEPVITRAHLEQVATIGRAAALDVFGPALRSREVGAVLVQLDAESIWKRLASAARYVTAAAAAVSALLGIVLSVKALMA